MNPRLLLPFLTILILSGCSPRQEKVTDAPLAPEVEVADITDEAESWADSLLATLTLRQKVAQMFMPALYASDDVWTVRAILEYADSCVGGVVLLKGDSEGASALADTMLSASRVPPFIAIDAEWGLAMRLVDAPEFPSNGSINPEADEQLLFDYGRELARESRLLGINMILGPVVDVNAPDGFMRRRSFGDNPRRVADLAVAYARGVESGGVLSVAKHFPGHGSVSSDSHRSKGVIYRTLNQLDSVDLYPFRRWIEQRLSGIMAGHLAVPSIDPEMRPAAVSRTVITDLLRTDLGFSGLVLTDALNMGGVEGYHSEEAVLAGADIIVAPAKTFPEIARVVGAVGEGRIPEADIDAHVRRILIYKYLVARTSRARGSLGSDSLRIPLADSIALRLRHR